VSACTITVLLISGAALELVGIALVAWDVLEARRTVRAMSDPQWGYREQAQRPRSLPALMAEVAAGNIKRRGLGVGLFACGLLVQTAANVAAL
jgi:hypothetical protein